MRLREEGELNELIMKKMRSEEMIRIIFDFKHF
jgi:hypothetical protein